MNCEEFHDQLADFLAGTSSSLEQQAMLEHVGSCRDCEGVVALEEALRAESRERDLENVPEAWVASMWPAVRAAIGADPRRRLPRRPSPAWAWLRPAAAIVLAVALVGAGYLFGRRDLTGSEDPAGSPIAEVETGSRFSNPPATTAEDELAELERLPDDVTLLSAGETEAVLERSYRVRLWILTLERPIDLSDGVQVGEIRSAIARLPPDDPNILPASLRSSDLRRWLRGRV